MRAFFFSVTVVFFFVAGSGSAFAGAARDVFVNGGNTLEIIAEDGSAQTLSLHEPTRPPVRQKPWALQPTDTILGHSRFRDDACLLIRRGETLLELHRDGNQILAWKPAAQDVAVLRDALVTSVDKHGRRFFLNAANKVFLVEKEEAKLLADLTSLKAENLNPAKLRAMGRYILAFSVKYDPDRQVVWVDNWVRKDPAPTDFAEAHTPGGYTPWRAEGARYVSPVTVLIQDLWLMEGGGNLGSQIYSLGDVFPRAPGKSPHQDCAAAEEFGALVRGSFTAPLKPFQALGMFSGCGGTLVE